MPIPGLTSLGFTAQEDSKYFALEPVDPAIQYETEGGVFISRPRNTRDPGVIITTGFTDITQADLDKILAFYGSVKGGSSSFQYVHPVTSVSYIVRFHGGVPKAKYVGAGSRKRYDVTEIRLRTV